MSAAIKNLIPIVPESISRGRIGFTLYCSDKLRGTVMFAREGYALTNDHLEKLSDSGRTFFINQDDSKSYLEYSLANFNNMVGSNELNGAEKAKLLQDIGYHTTRKLIDYPESAESHNGLGRVVDAHITLLQNEPESAGDLLVLSSIDNYSYSHSINVGVLNILLCHELFGENHESTKEYGLAGSLHDIGKIYCKQNILLKHGELTYDEYEHMKKHCLFSQRILSNQKYPRSVLSAAMSHHERIDGHGYPHGVDNQDIPLIARITAVADVYDALTSQKVYSQEKPHVEALEIMAADKGHFDPEVFEALLRIVLRNPELTSRFMTTFHNGSRNRK